MPYYTFTCRECGGDRDFLVAINDVEPVIDRLCPYCAIQTRFERSYKGYIPGIGEVRGAGGSPSR